MALVKRGYVESEARVERGGFRWFLFLGQSLGNPEGPCKKPSYHKAALLKRPYGRESTNVRERERVPGREGARSLLQVRMGGLSCHKGLVWIPVLLLLCCVTLGRWITGYRTRDPGVIPVPLAESGCGVAERLRFHVAVTVAFASSCSSDLTPSLRTLYASGVALKSKKKTKTQKQTNKQKEQRTWLSATPKNKPSQSFGVYTSSLFLHVNMCPQVVIYTKKGIVLN